MRAGGEPAEQPGEVGDVGDQRDLPTARLGLAAGLTDEVRTVLGREPIDFAEFAHRERAAWTR